MRSRVQYLSILWLLFLPLMGAIGMPFLASVLIVLFLVGITLAYPYIALANKKRTFEKEEREESLLEGGIEEPRIFRDLSPFEKQVLHDLHKKSKWIVDHGFLLIAFFAVFDTAGVFWILNSSYETIENIIFPIYAVGFMIQIALAGSAAKVVPTYLDLRSPVFKVQGKIIKEKIRNRRSTDYYVTIRGLRFSEENFRDLSRFFYTVEDGDEVAVEYSPRTKHIWKIYKTEDLK